MEDSNDKRAKPLTNYTYSEINKNLSVWRDHLRKELECLIYIKQSYSSSEDTQNNKINNLIPKIENLCLKEIECINEFLNEIINKAYVENSEKIYVKVESIRDNYNKIMVNIEKMVASVPSLKSIKLKYENNMVQNSTNLDFNSLSPQVDESSNFVNQAPPEMDGSKSIHFNNNDKSFSKKNKY